MARPSEGTDPFWCYSCTGGDHAACKGVAWQPDIPCECAHA